MTSALVYLIVTSAKNGWLVRLRRLRQPKYLVSVLLAGCYFGFLFFAHRQSMQDPGGRNLSAAFASDGTLSVSVGAIILFVLAAGAWILPEDRSALIFTEAEIAFLFPAPVSRRTLIHFKLAKTQLRIAFSALLFTALFGAQRSGSLWIHAIGWWLIFSCLTLHGLGASLARSKLRDRGITTWLRRTIALTGIGVLAGGAALWAWRSLPPPPILKGLRPDAIDYYAKSVLRSGPLPYVLYPFQLVVRPFLARGAASFLLAIGPALLVLAALYLWVIRSDVAFEEASIEASQRAAERVAAIRSGQWRPFASKAKGQRPPFMLSPTGFPAIAFLWKNLISSASAWPSRRLLVSGTILVAAVLVTGGARGWTFGISFLAAMILLGSLLLGADWVRQDFRQDLPMADVLKAYPVSAWQIALGELLAPVAVLTLLQYVLMIFAVLGSSGVRENLPPGGAVPLVIGFVVLAPAFNLISVAIPNAALLILPAWVSTGRRPGFEASGQRLLMLIGRFVVLSVALIPAGLVFAAVWYVASMGFGEWWAIGPASVAAAIVLATEGGVAVLVLGGLFRSLDISQEGSTG